jgi:GTPase involved in cell partitioning and DNA repair
LSSVSHLSNNDENIDSKALTIDIIKQLFPNISTEQLIIIDNTIDFMINNKLQKQISTISKFFETLSSTLKKINRKNKKSKYKKIRKKLYFKLSSKYNSNSRFDCL